MIGQLRFIKRYREVINVLVRYGFSEILEKIKIIRSGFFRKKKESDKLPSYNRPVRLRLALEELGPTFIKVGQLLSTRIDLLPHDYIEELTRLQDDVGSFSGEQAVSIMENELGRKKEEVFQTFENQPMAAASISQVHYGTLVDGSEVAVKIKRPYIENQVFQDIQILKNTAYFVDRNTQWGKIYRFGELAEEIERILLEELNFKGEISNAQRLRRNFSDNAAVYIPGVFEEYSSRNVLTTEYLHGTNLNTLLEDKNISASRKKIIADNIVDAYFKQIFVHGFFHGDPHPGNIIVMPGDRIALVDFGTAGIIDEIFQEQLQLLLKYLTTQNAEEVAEMVIEMGFVPGDINKRSLVIDLARMLDKYYQLPLEKIEINELFPEFLSIVGKHNIRMPYEFLLLSKTIITVESIISQLDPEFKIIDAVNRYKPFIQKSYLRRGKRKTKRLLSIYERFLRQFPENINSVSQQAASGDLKLNMEITQAEPMLKRIGNMINRLSFSIVLASIIVGLSLTIGREEILFVRKFPVAEVALIIAGLAGIWWLWTILRSEK